LTDFDFSVFLDDIVPANHKFTPEVKNGGCIIVNSKMLEEKGLPVPQSYQDLLDPQYKGLISMPDPKASGTGYMFYKCLVETMGEKEALDYFKKLSENVLQFTSSGNGPINALMQQEVAIGLCMTQNAVTQLDEGADLSILFFEGGAPLSVYSQSIVAGKETNAAVKEVFEYMVGEFKHLEMEKFGGEQIHKDKVYTSKNYPTNIVLADMGVNTLVEKERLLALWDIT
jgi:iron(III) transport system substrate-binding protein